MPHFAFYFNNVCSSRLPGLNRLISPASYFSTQASAQTAWSKTKCQAGFFYCRSSNWDPRCCCSTPVPYFCQALLQLELECDTAEWQQPLVHPADETLACWWPVALCQFCHCWGQPTCLALRPQHRVMPCLLWQNICWPTCKFSLGLAVTAFFLLTTWSWMNWFYFCLPLCGTNVVVLRQDWQVIALCRRRYNQHKWCHMEKTQTWSGGRGLERRRHRMQGGVVQE